MSNKVITQKTVMMCRKLPGVWLFRQVMLSLVDTFFCSKMLRRHLSKGEALISVS